jgi:hypothetical protein
MFTEDPEPIESVKEIASPGEEAEEDRDLEYGPEVETAVAPAMACDDDDDDDDDGGGGDDDDDDDGCG